MDPRHNLKTGRKNKSSLIKICCGPKNNYCSPKNNYCSPISLFTIALIFYHLYSSRFNLANLVNCQRDFNLDITWTFLATSHGKGSVDAVGGVVKNVVNRRVISQNLIINNARDFSSLAIQHIKHDKIQVIYIEEDEMSETRSLLEERLKLVPPIPQLQKMHHFEAHSTSQLRCWPSSKCEANSMRIVNQTFASVAVTKRGRGRPRKLTVNDKAENQPPKKRGRPAKK